MYSWETYFSRDLQNDAVISAEGEERLWNCGNGDTINAESELL